MHTVHLSWLLSSAGGGIPPVVYALSRHQRASGCESVIFGVRDPREEAHGAELFDTVGPLAVGFAPALARALASRGPDLVHLHGLFTWPSQVASAWTARFHRPVVVSPHGMLEPWALANSAWKKRVFRFLVEDRNLARAACLHALSAAEGSNLRRLGLRNPIAVIPNGFDCGAVPAAPDTAAFGRTVPSVAGRRVLLFLGRIHPKKGLLHLLDAWRLLHEAGDTSDWVLVVAGPDQLDHTAELARRSSAYGLDDSVLLVGPLHGRAKADALAASSAFVLPSFSEGFSMAVLEAMAWRLPVVISQQCNLDVEKPGAGMLCDPDAHSVASRLRELLSLSDAQRRAMGERGRREVEERYDWRVVSQSLVNVYAWLLQGGAPPANVEVLT